MTTHEGVFKAGNRGVEIYDPCGSAVMLLYVRDGKFTIREYGCPNATYSYTVPNEMLSAFAAGADIIPMLDYVLERYGEKWLNNAILWSNGMGGYA